MKNNLIYLCNYNDVYKKRKASASYNSSAQKWLTTITDSVVTLTISVCTIFCIYLAYTML